MDDQGASGRERDAFSDLVAVCRRLRAPDGCPWDREQTLGSMTPYLTEEAVEAGEAIASGDPNHIAEELGDLAFLAIFCLELSGEQGGPGLAEAFESAARKLKRRHPHVYGDAEIASGDAAYRQWQEIKKGEKDAVGGEASLLGEIHRGLPALVAAYRVQEKAGAVGFDWPDVSGPLGKVREELGEIERELGRDSRRALAREIGDLLFATVNLARHLTIDPERELRAASGRFRERFEHIERRLREQGRSPGDASLEELDALWEEAKTLGPPGRTRAKRESAPRASAGEGDAP
ncbi:MAG TPA: nucleoside triphosphate pyrophosphohydrolase [Terriglobales bacterium]|nr:nucleoside triphosphate pyrophosphohydrolase [Terriglobales bacterium]